MNDPHYLKSVVFTADKSKWQGWVDGRQWHVDADRLLCGIFLPDKF
jgi:hypothetical protein